MRVWLIIAAFFILSALLIISNNGLVMSNGENLGVFLKMYSSWANQLYGNFQTITGDVIKLEWFPK